MALSEVYLFTAYRCCYCGFWNPARKQKPSAPKLDFDANNTITNVSSEDTSPNIDEEPVKLNELETCTQSDTGMRQIFPFICQCIYTDDCILIIVDTV